LKKEERKMKKQIVKIEKRTAFAVEIKKGQQFRIVESEGPQLAVLIAVYKNDLSEFFSTGNTKISLGVGPFKRKTTTGVMPYWIQKGDTLISNKWNPILTVEEDTYGKHDIIFDPCDTFLNGNIFGQGKGYPGCRELHTEALKKWGIKYAEIPAGVNLFQNTRYSEEGMVVYPTNARKDDMVIFKAHRDLIISVTACPCPLGESKGIRMEIEEAEG
jgi:uncharacterized protein